MSINEEVAFIHDLLNKLTIIEMNLKKITKTDENSENQLKLEKALKNTEYLILIAKARREDLS